MQPLITIVAPTFNHGILLELFCLNMVAQTRQDWKCIILHDGCEQSQDPLARESSKTSKKIMERFLLDLRFQYIETPERANLWGHNLRDIGQQMVDTKYLHHTNADNQYTIRWLEYALSTIEKEQADLLYYTSFHNYRHYIYFDANLAKDCIDFNNYIVKTEMAQTLGFPWRSFGSDGDQIEAFKRHFPNGKFVKSHSGLTFHN